MSKLTASLLFIAAISIMLAPMASAADVAGKVGYMSGSLIAKHADGTVKILGPKSQVMAGDELETSNESFAQVLMNDGAKMTLRPNSNLKIDAFKFNKDAPKDDSAVLRLLRGGFRTVSGLIGKRGNPDAYRLKASTATIGIRGTDFTTRLCGDKECEDAPAIAQPQPPITQVSAGRVMLVKGELTAKDTEGKIRKLVPGSSVYEGEILSTAKDSHAVVAFRDEGRVTLEEETVFHLLAFKYIHQANAKDSEENAVFRLLKGGVRVVTGLIGRVNHDNYRFKLATATIGIRGTGFDVWCNAECATGGANPGATQTEPLKGAGVYVWSGQVALNTEGASQLVSVGQAAILSREMRPVPVTTIPASITDNKTPRPDSLKIDMQKEFESDPKSTPPAPTSTPDTNGGKATPGVYVTVNDGQVIMTQNNGQTLNVEKGQTGFANNLTLIQLPATPKFMSGEKLPDQKSMGAGLSNKSSGGPTQSGCVVK